MSFAFAFDVDGDGAMSEAPATAPTPQCPHEQMKTVPFVPIDRESLVRYC